MDAQAALSSYEYSAARDFASKAMSLDKSDESGIYYSVIARSYYEEGNYREAIGAYNSAIDLNSQNASFFNNLGSTYFALARETDDSVEKIRLLEESVVQTKKSIDLDSSASNVYANASTSLNELERFDESLELLQSWEGESDGSIEYQKAATAALLENESQVIGFLSQAIKLDNTNALRSAADEDFSSMHANEGFRSILKTALGGELFSAVEQAWEE